MFRILIVEDDTRTSEQLKYTITEEVDRVIADTATNVPDARRFILTAEESHHPYHAIVLDLKLPPQKGLKAELDETICQMIKEKMPDAVVAHITAFDQDEQVKNHLELAHNRQVDRSFRLAKNKDFAIELINILKRCLYSNRIEEKLKRLFNGGSIGEPIFQGRSRDSMGSRSVTHELADLTRDISAHWNDLEDRVRNKVRLSFNVTVNGNEVIVSLF